MSKKPTQNPNIHLAKAWTLVTARGRILIDYVGASRADVAMFYDDWHKERGHKIKQITLVNHKP